MRLFHRPTKLPVPRRIHPRALDGQARADHQERGLHSIFGRPILLRWKELCDDGDPPGNCDHREALRFQIPSGIGKRIPGYPGWDRRTGLFHDGGAIVQSDIHKAKPDLRLCISDGTVKRYGEMNLERVCPVLLEARSYTSV